MIPQQLRFKIANNKIGKKKRIKSNSTLEKKHFYKSIMSKLASDVFFSRSKISNHSCFLKWKIAGVRTPKEHVNKPPTFLYDSAVGNFGFFLIKKFHFVVFKLGRKKQD